MLGPYAEGSTKHRLHAAGKVLLYNTKTTFTTGAPAPYFSNAGGVFGQHIQSGSIQPTSPPTLVNGKIQFTAIQGYDPYSKTNFHVISTKQGLIYCTWTATFTVRPIGNNRIVISGPGAFTIQGGTGIYANAGGSFTTFFSTTPIPVGPGLVPLSDAPVNSYAVEWGTLVLP